MCVFVFVYLPDLVPFQLVGVIALHKPHPHNTLKRYQIEQAIKILRPEGWL